MCCFLEDLSLISLLLLMQLSKSLSLPRLWPHHPSFNRRQLPLQAIKKDSDVIHARLWRAHASPPSPFLSQRLCSDRHCRSKLPCDTTHTLQQQESPLHLLTWVLSEDSQILLPCYALPVICACTSTCLGKN